MYGSIDLTHQIVVFASPIPGKRPLLGKCPCTASIQTCGILIPGKHWGLGLGAYLGHYGMIVRSSLHDHQNT